MSYHNGSVWPHDTALVAAGMARYGLVEPAMKLMGGLFSACLYIDLQRLPELFCGFSIRHGEAPTAYPVACMPQAWSVAAVYLLLQSCLQVTVDSPRRILSFDKPALPEYLERVRIRNLMVGSGVFDLELERRDWDIGIHLIAKPSDWQVIVRR
jgi:glycogen debranching enzyme